MTDFNINAKDVEWVVNNDGDLGVKIGQQFFFLYKGHSLQYRKAKNDDGSPMMWRPVEKREFGASCRSTTSPLPMPFDHDGNEWFPLPKHDPEANPQPVASGFSNEERAVIEAARELKNARWKAATARSFGADAEDMYENRLEIENRIKTVCSSVYKLEEKEAQQEPAPNPDGNKISPM